MQIKVLQGLNLKNPVTTVVAEMDAVKPKLLDFFKELHPVFMKDYKINGKTLEVQTHIPSLWKTTKFMGAIEQFSTGKMSFEDARVQMLEVVRIQIRSMSTIPLLHAAHELGFETSQYYINKGLPAKLRLNRVYAVGIGAEQHYFYAAGSSKDSHGAVKNQKDKAFTNQVIENLGLPIAKWTLVETRKDLEEKGNEVGYPLVLKPGGLTGGQGVQIGMKNLKELQEAWDRTHEYYEHGMKFPEMKSKSQKEILIQRMLQGEDYRVLVINGKVEVATHRLQARVTGDGKSTIEELINEENKNPARDIQLPTHTLKPITIDESLKNVLRKQDLTIDYVPKKDEEVRVRDVASMSQGGITADVTDKMHPQIKAICESLAKSVHGYVIGVDVLCQDITKPLTLDNGGIIEMNTMPEMYLNIYPVIGKQYPKVPEKMIKGLMAGQQKTKKVVVLGDFTHDEIKAAMAKVIKRPGKVGRLHKGTYYIGEYPINTGLTINDGVLSIKKNKTLNTIVLHYEKVEDVERNGFGLNTIDLLLTKKDLLGKIKKTADAYTRRKLISETIVQ